MSYIVAHRYRYPISGSSAPFGPIIHQFATVTLDEKKLATVLFPLLRTPGQHYVRIDQWVAMMRWFEKYPNHLGSWFNLTEQRQIGVWNVGGNNPDLRRDACPLIFTSDWLRMTEQEKCDAFNAAQKDIHR